MVRQCLWCNLILLLSSVAVLRIGTLRYALRYALRVLLRKRFELGLWIIWRRWNYLGVSCWYSCGPVGFP